MHILIVTVAAPCHVLIFIHIIYLFRSCVRSQELCATHGLEALSAMLIFKGVQYTIKNM